jgi:serine/threonine protein kinase, bacterial
LLNDVAIGAGRALVFEWTDAVPVGRQYEQAFRLDGLSLAQRSGAVQQIYDFHVHAAALDWVAIDLYDGSVLVDPAIGRVALCDLDVYEKAPTRNRMGRMWGSDRFMSPEEYELGAELDEVTNVFTLGALAHTFLGDDATKSPEAWRGSPEQYRVAEAALRPRREERWASVAALAAAWRAASETVERSPSDEFGSLEPG